MVSDRDITPGGISGLPSEVIFDSSNIDLWFVLSLYPAACLTSFYSSRKKLSEWGNHVERVKTILREEVEEREVLVRGVQRR